MGLKQASFNRDEVELNIFNCKNKQHKRAKLFTVQKYENILQKYGKYNLICSTKREVLQLKTFNFNCRNH